MSYVRWKNDGGRHTDRSERWTAALFRDDHPDRKSAAETDIETDPQPVRDVPGRDLQHRPGKTLLCAGCGGEGRWDQPCEVCPDTAADGVM